MSLFLSSHLNSISVQTAAGGSTSLLGELEAGLNKRIDAEKEKRELEKKQKAEASAGGMENCEEYFFLVSERC
tara:strand:+ start:1803 stop:2021 length:219 start_codon:yes stop_codon:yes gene_type:complete